MAKKVLFLHNDPIAPEAMLGEAFDECGYEVEVFEVVSDAETADPAFDVTFPDPLDYDVVVPLGSRWGVNDGFDWITSEAAMTREAHQAGVPLLGVCFGGQLLAHALGGSVDRAPVPEIGWYDVESTRADLVPSGPWFQWHFDRFTVPEGALEIARNGNAPQAFLLRHSMGIQFHPELDERLLERWLTGAGGEEIEMLGWSADGLRNATADRVDDAAQAGTRPGSRLPADDDGRPDRGSALSPDRVPS